MLPGPLFPLLGVGKNSPTTVPNLDLGVSFGFDLCDLDSDLCNPDNSGGAVVACRGFGLPDLSEADSLTSSKGSNGNDSFFDTSSIGGNGIPFNFCNSSSYFCLSVGSTPILCINPSNTSIRCSFFPVVNKD